ncbi:hypothetical protein PHYSODRAFT_294625 [Phytophthora sojae]|uniref:Uncharacterized protein n=1 Tax=Phytophthora sojae (strain P6497) TaxID=1094619 RepID=G4YKY7_PHYSP|nr:hypothetical protein PHYSODRAFT_294625 [Phytophthora sojae]EGZ29478.1 hypothetical protein PHYSODRAFT_294625 [Phytophthora sojae]|eukprot:XP_009516753.1 hypothetical protein PHYSODRAFT_294625 [Phytophthora sojae]
MGWTSAQTSPEFGNGYMTLRDSPSDQLLAVLFDVRSVTRHPKTGALTSQQYGWTFLPVLAHSRFVNACTIQLPLFQGEVNLGVLKSAIGGLSTLVDDIGNEKVKQLVPVAEDGASLFVRIQDPQVPHLSSQPIVNASLSKMVPSRLSAKYVYDSTKIAASKKKTPVSKLLPTNTPETQFEKEMNQAFAQLREDGSCRPQQHSSSAKKKSRKSKPRFRLPRLRLRPKKTPLQLEDFDDVRYKMEIVRLGDDASDSIDERVPVLESVFLAFLCLLLLGGCVAVGFATHLIEYSREVLSWLLPMLLLPLAWVVALVVWERRAIAMQSKIATQ